MTFNTDYYMLTKAFYTLPKNYLPDPAIPSGSFLTGKRVKHFKPISLVLLLAGIYGFLSHYFNINLLSNNYEVRGSGEEFIQTKATIDKMSEWISQHYAILALVQIPIFSIGTYLCFKKTGYHFIEHIVINAFITGQKLIIHILVFPLYYYFNNTPFIKSTARATDIIGYATALWTIIQLFNELSLTERLWRTLLSMVISLIIVFIILILISKALLSS